MRNQGSRVPAKKQRKKKKEANKPIQDTDETKTINEQSEEEKKKRIRAYDYRSWDKFDVVSDKDS